MLFEIPQRSELEGPVLRLAHAVDLRLTWKGARALLVEYPDNAVINYAASGGAMPLMPQRSLGAHALNVLGENVGENLEAVCTEHTDSRSLCWRRLR